MSSTFTTTPEDLIDDDPRVYSDRTALAMAEHSIAIYEKTDRYRFAVASAGFTGGTVLTRGPAQVGIAWHPKVIVISPRGSDEPRDWLGNFASVFRRQWRPILPKGCRIGVGFLRQAKRIAPHVLAKVKWARYIFPKAEVVVDGHSLGAALVAPIVSYLDWGGVPVTVAYMLEPPRPGNAAFADWYDQVFSRFSTPTYNVTNIVGGETDMVTRTPLRRHGARHVGQRVLLSDGKMHYGIGAWKRHRADNPVGYLKAWRIISKAICAVRAHSGQRLLKTLRARV